MAARKRSEPADPEPDHDEAEPPAPGRGETAPEPAGATHAEEDEAWDPHDAEHPDADERIAALEAELAAAKDKYLRARADYDNVVRRTEEERGRLAQAAAARIIERFLDPLQVLERAAADLAAVDENRAKGVRMAHDQMAAALRQEGLEPVPGVGAGFDHHHHEAIAREPSERPEGEVLEVIRPGYRLGGRLLRAALVKVSAGPE